MFMTNKHLLYSQKAFFRLFPPPDFLLMPAVGVDVSDRAVRFLEMKPSADGFTVKRFGEQSLPEGVIKDGDIKDVGTLKTALIALRRDYNLSFIRVALPEEKAFLFRTEVPQLSPEETRENIGFQLEEHVPIKVSEAVFDYSIVPPLFGKNGGGLREVVVSVFPKPIIDGYWEAFTGAGLTPLSFEMEGSAIARSVVKEGDMGTYLIADIGSLRTGLTIVSGGAVHFSTTIDVGGSVITEVIREKMNISESEAVALKQEGAFSRHGTHRDIFPALLESLAPLKNEISKHYVYWHNHPDKKDATPPSIEKVILCGSEASLEGLAEYLTLALRSPVEVADVWKNAFSIEKYVPPLPFNKSLAFATAIGLALRFE
jgi:type IV pilus assembly protein PilM